MRLSLIGMSGTGKSHWSSRLVARGFTRFCCDELIANKLRPELTGSGTERSMGEWMGFPYELQYQAKEAKYLAFEVEVLKEILTSLEANLPPLDQNVIVDTTGSVIYTDPALLRRLRQQTTLVYLDTPPEVQEKMRLAYIDSPPPVLWRDKFHQLPGESNEAALARSYPDLLASRTRRYKQWAEVTLDYYRLRQPGFTVDDFLNEIEQMIKVPVE